MNGRVALLAMLAACLVAGGDAQAGHEFPFYPSFYPQEIRIDVVDTGSAAGRLQSGTLHAYVGADPLAGGGAPASVGVVESLGAYVVLTVNPAAPFFADRARRCLAAGSVAAMLAGGAGRYERHPYPVTPYHPDFLQHADLAAAATRGQSLAGWTGPPLRVQPRGAVAENLAPAGLGGSVGDWDVAVETVDVTELGASQATRFNGWLGPPWTKEGWFHAYLLQGPSLADPGARQSVEGIVGRLAAGAYRDLVERLNLERRLLSLLGAGCERVVAGYTTRREYVNVEYSAGVENVGHDAQAGLNSAIFPRTVKLKDFPWNGWLTVGIPQKPSAAWNPVGGFTDPAGRLVWAAVGDPALFPSPHGGHWVPNRVTLAAVDRGRIGVPEDALVPEPVTGLLRKVGAGQHATTRLVYRVLGSRFHDGTRMTVGDVVYAVSALYRGSDPVVERATARIRGPLVGLRPVRVETDVLAFGEDKLTYEVPIVEIYLDHPAADAQELAAVVPPWSTLPWHVIVLMEEAVARGLAAFSREAAERRGVPWLDLARDAALLPRLVALVDELGGRSYVPPALQGFAFADEANARWTALRKFYDAHGHLLVTNGPYRLQHVSDASTVLQVFRDPSYPKGVGAFNVFATPLRAYVTRAELRRDALVVRGDVDKIERFGRELRIVREPFSKKAVEQDKRSLPVCHYVVVGPDHHVVGAGTSAATEADSFRVELPRSPESGSHRILVALSLDGNLVNLPLQVVEWTP